MLDAIFNRRSVRSFTDEPVSTVDLDTLIRAALFAPSARNKQPCHFIVCDDADMQKKFQSVQPFSKMLDTAPILILVCGDTSAAAKGFYTEDCAAATQNLLLAAHELSLGACWLGITPNSELQTKIGEFFGLPEGILAFCGIALGHPAKISDAPPRQIETKIHKNVW